MGVNEKQIQPTKYLYDISPDKFIVLPYIDALKVKIDAAKVLLHKLVHDECNWADRDNERINRVISAIKFNEYLLKELNDIDIVNVESP